MRYRTFADILARCFAAGEPNVDEIAARGARIFGKPWRWVRLLAKRYVAAFGEQSRPRRRDAFEFIREDRAFWRGWPRYRHEVVVEHWLLDPPRMRPVDAARHWDVPAIESGGDLAAWLGLTDGELAWFADLKGFGYRYDRPRVQNYHYRVLLKQSGKVRLIEEPKQRLKELQRKILAEILERIPPHPAAHGFRKARSIRTFVAPHVGRRVVLRMDVQDFFPTISRARIQAFFRTAGYPESVADLLGGICTNRAPRKLCKGAYAHPHLPQGAPTSPALANLCSYRIDCRLAGLAKSAGAEYTRYADDLAFSGGEDFERRAERFAIHVAAILHEEGFAVHHRKTRIMRHGVRQHLAGLVTNEHANVYRRDFDVLKATLTNCVHRGPESQNRDAHPSFRAHLEGRVAFVESINPARGKRLREIFARIPW
jgi:hypothetical protein